MTQQWPFHTGHRGFWYTAVATNKQHYVQESPDTQEIPSKWIGFWLGLGLTHLGVSLPKIAA